MKQELKANPTNEVSKLALPADAAAINAHYDALEAALQAEIAKTRATIKRLMRDAVNATDAAKLATIRARITEQESIRRRLQRDVFTRMDEIDQQREAALNALAADCDYCDSDALAGDESGLFGDY